MRTLRSWLPAVAVLALSACPPAATETLSVTPPSLAIAVGEARVVSAQVSSSSGGQSAATGATWTSSNEGVASVSVNADGSASIVGVSVGEATITVGLRKATATLAVRVSAAPVTLARLELSPESPSLALGTMLRLTATGVYSDDSRRDVSPLAAWSSSAPTVATVSSAGALTGLSVGATTVTATLQGVSASVEVAVTAVTLAAIEVTPALPSLARGTTRAMTATGRFSDGSLQDLTSQATWASADSAVATVSATGVVTAVAAGTSAISAAFGGVSGNTTLTVTAAALASLEVSPASFTLPRGLTQQLSVTGRFSDDSTQDVTGQVTWSSAAATVATVSSSGLVTGVATGATELHATLEGVTGSARVVVTAATLQSIELSPQNPSVVAGFTVALTATGRFSDGTTSAITTTATWSSSAPAIASVSNAFAIEGVVSGLAAGTSTITARLNGVAGTTTVTVSPATLESLAVAPATVSLALGLTRAYTATGTFSDGSTADLTTQATWTVTPGATASISNAAGSHGLLTALAQGTATVRATVGARFGEGALTVTAPELLRVDLTPASPSVPRGGTLQLTATAVFTNGNPTDVTAQATWSSASSGVATVSSGGLLSGVVTGTSVVTATYLGVTGTTTATVTPPDVQSIAVTPATASIALGRTQAFTATATYTDTTTGDVTTQVSWVSGTPATASIASSGLATSLAQGSSTITATLGGVSGTATLTVTAPELVSLSVTGSSTTIRRGDTVQLVATGTYTDASTAPVTTTATWSSAAAGTASVSDAAGTKGLVTGMNVGSTSITATVGSISGSVTIAVTPPDLTGITVTPAAPSVAVGGSQAFVATGTYSDTSTAILTNDVTWASSAPAVATVSDAAGTKGQAQALSAGTTTISATLGAVSGSTVLTVTPRTLTGIAVTPATPSVAKGRTQAFTATGTYSDTSTDDITASVTWSSGTEAVATIASTGVASTLAEGSTTITATQGSVSGTATLTVTAAVLDSLAVTGRATFPLGHGVQFTATGTMSDGTTPDLTGSVTWSSSADAVALPHNAAGIRGIVEGVSVGEATLTATQGAVSGTLAVRVRAKNAPASTRCGTGLVISQVYGAGGNSGALFKNDFIELHNAGTVPVSLAGMSVQYASSAGTSWTNKTDLNPTVTLNPGDFYLVAQAGGTVGADVAADQTGAISMAASNGKVALVNGTAFLTGSCPTASPSVIDFVGYGTADCFEGAAATAPISTTLSAQRAASGCRDTNSNVTDLPTLSPSPRNLATPGVLCDCDVTGVTSTYAADYCALQFPASLSLAAGAVTDPVYTRAFEAGVTEAAGAPAGLRAEVGYGVSMSDPSTSTGWSWWSNTYNVQQGNDDEYVGRFVAPAAATYSYTGRVSFDGVNWTYCDLNGAGSDTGLTLDTSQLGVLTVTP